MPDAEFLIELHGVGKSYAAAEGNAVLPILRGVDLRVKRGESLAVVGPSGSGKTTLLNLLGALDRADTGRVVIDGQDLGSLDEAAMANLRNRKIGFVFQSHHLLPHLSVRENVLIPTLPLRDQAAKQAGSERASRLLKRVGLGERLHHRPGQLSGGECQRVAVVRALTNRPALVLADEPTGALDRETARGLATLLVELNREEAVTLIVVTHSMELAREMGRVLEFGGGELKEAGRRDVP